MPTFPPVLLVDNGFDRINLYQNAVLSASSTAPGTDVRAIGSYRRERAIWRAAAAAAGNYVQSDLGAGVTLAPDFVFIDRGHKNLWGTTVRFYTGANFVTLTVPAQGTVGGDPTSAVMCVTEEGALYSFFAAMAAAQTQKFYVVDNVQPTLTGIIAGVRFQLLRYLNKFDPDQGSRTDRSQESDAGYLAYDRAYAWRTCDLDLSLIGGTEYDSTIRSLRRLLFEKNQPAVVVHNYGTVPAQAWMYQYAGKTWSFPTSRTYRKGVIPMREVGALIR